jgi:predicted GNAT family acetyltransferase
MKRFRDNTSARRYELETESGVIFARYRDSEGARTILHVETPLAARGRGLAAQLMDAIVARARTDGVKLRARCSYAQAYFEARPETADVQA